MQLTAENDTELKPENQTAEAFRILSGAKRELTGVLGNFQVQTDEIEANQKRRSEAQKDEQDLLAAEMDETEQVEKINRLASLQRLLESKIEQGRKRIESIETELRHAAEAAYKSFCQAISDLVDARRAEYIARLKEMVAPEQWPWCEVHALAFIRHTPDLLALGILGDQAGRMLQARDARKATEHLLMDIAKLEAEARQ